MANVKWYIHLNIIQILVWLLNYTNKKYETDHEINGVLQNLIQQHCMHIYIYSFLLALSSINKYKFKQFWVQTIHLGNSKLKIHFDMCINIEHTTSILQVISQGWLRTNYFFTSCVNLFSYICICCQPGESSYCNH